MDLTDVASYPQGSVIGVFPTSDIDGVQLRDPETVEADPHPDHV